MCRQATTQATATTASQPYRTCWQVHLVRPYLVMSHEGGIIRVQALRITLALDAVNLLLLLDDTQAGRAQESLSTSSHMDVSDVQSMFNIGGVEHRATIHVQHRPLRDRKSAPCWTRFQVPSLVSDPRTPAQRPTDHIAAVGQDSCCRCTRRVALCW